MTYFPNLKLEITFESPASVFSRATARSIASIDFLNFDERATCFASMWIIGTTASVP